ncbi:MAG: 30S ribosomal protein S6 [Thermodesulfobacteriota bacterium]|nr:30S ribosomal protein S6 [Thermodesulfobacteriota bacterium]MEE2975012.1 30S ribosomal protein S6 [Thermodesulfobacteriota bacterium]|tara:strand:+ start:61491 stop:61799 length:309 start_codon:yes stop_codon:yes gene_type:complete
MTNFYEVLFIVPTSLEEEANKELSEKIKKTIEEKHSSKIVKFEKWADRKLAYTIQDYKEGRYYLLETDCSSECIKELESILSFEKTKVLRFIIDKIEKRVKK